LATNANVAALAPGVDVARLRTLVREHFDRQLTSLDTSVTAAKAHAESVAPSNSISEAAAVAAMLDAVPLLALEDGEVRMPLLLRLYSDTLLLLGRRGTDEAPPVQAADDIVVAPPTARAAQTAAELLNAAEEVGSDAATAVATRALRDAIRVLRVGPKASVRAPAVAQEVSSIRKKDDAAFRRASAYVHLSQYFH
jgi:hypothetical protein